MEILFPIFIGSIVIGGLLASFINSCNATSLRRRAISLGDMTGKTYDEIVQVLGDPQSVSGDSEQHTAVWSSFNPHLGAGNVEDYTISIHFRGNIFNGFHESCINA